MYTDLAKYENMKISKVLLVLENSAACKKQEEKESLSLTVFAY